MSHCKKCVAPRVSADPASLGCFWQLIKGEISWAGGNQIIRMLIQQIDSDQAKVLNASQTYFICLQYPCPFSKGFIHIPDFSNSILVQLADNFRKKSDEGASAISDALGTVHSDTPIHSPAALQPLQKYLLLLRLMKYEFTVHTHTALGWQWLWKMYFVRLLERMSSKIM